MGALFRLNGVGIYDRVRHPALGMHDECRILIQVESKPHNADGNIITAGEDSIFEASFLVTSLGSLKQGRLGSARGTLSSARGTILPAE